MNVLYVLSRYAFISSFFSLLCLLKQYQTGNMKTTTDNKKRILFICLGNICRSPAAHAVMQHMVDERGLSSQYEIDSAGIGGWHIGQLPDKRMREHGNRRGYRIDHHARQFDSSVDFDRFDHIIVMDEDNFRNITSQTTDEKARARCFVWLISSLNTHMPPVFQTLITVDQPTLSWHLT